MEKNIAYMFAELLAVILIILGLVELSIDFTAGIAILLIGVAFILICEAEPKEKLEDKWDKE